jgi:hypothetical protein
MCRKGIELLPTAAYSSARDKPGHDVNVVWLRRLCWGTLIPRTLCTLTLAPGPGVEGPREDTLPMHLHVLLC